MANLLTAQDAFDNAVWTKESFAVITADQIAAPDTTITADNLGTTDSDGNGYAFVSQAITVPGPDTYVLSVCAQKDSISWAWLDTFLFGNNGTSWFDIENGVVGTKDANHDTSGITDVGGGWYQCWITFDLSADLTGEVGIGMGSDDAVPTVPLLGAPSSIYIWRGQLEAGSTPTACAAPPVAMQGGGRVLSKGTLPKFWKEWEETQPNESPPKIISPRDRIAELAGTLKMPRKR